MKHIKYFLVGLGIVGGCLGLKYIISSFPEIVLGTIILGCLTWGAWKLGKSFYEE